MENEQNQNEVKEISGKKALGIVLGVVGLVGFAIGGVIFYRVGITDGAMKFCDSLCKMAYETGRIRIKTTAPDEYMYLLSVGKKFGKQMLDKTLEEFDAGIAMSSSGWVTVGQADELAK